MDLHRFYLANNLPLPTSEEGRAGFDQLLLDLRKKYPGSLTAVLAPLPVVSQATSPNVGLAGTRAGADTAAAALLCTGVADPAALSRVSKARPLERITEESPAFVAGLPHSVPPAGPAIAAPASAAPASAGVASAVLCRPSVPPSSSPCVLSTAMVAAYRHLLLVLAADLRVAAAADMLELIDFSVGTVGGQYVLIHIQYRSFWEDRPLGVAGCESDLEQIIAQAAFQLALWPHYTYLVTVIPEGSWAIGAYR